MEKSARAATHHTTESPSYWRNRYAERSPTQPKHPATGRKHPLSNPPHNQIIQLPEKSVRLTASQTTKSSSQWKNWPSNRQFRHRWHHSSTSAFAKPHPIESTFPTTCPPNRHSHHAHPSRRIFRSHISTKAASCVETTTQAPLAAACRRSPITISRLASSNDAVGSSTKM